MFFRKLKLEVIPINQLIISLLPLNDMSRRNVNFVYFWKFAKSFIFVALLYKIYLFLHRKLSLHFFLLFF